MSLKKLWSHRQVQYWCPVYCYAGLIFFVSSISLPEVPMVGAPGMDKVAHFFEYAVLALLIYRACITSPKLWLVRHRVLISVLVSVLYALSDEIHQYFVPMRQMSLADFIADSLGAVTIILLVNLLKKPVKSVSIEQPIVEE